MLRCNYLSHVPRTHRVVTVAAAVLAAALKHRACKHCAGTAQAVPKKISHDKRLRSARAHSYIFSAAGKKLPIAEDAVDQGVDGGGRLGQHGGAAVLH